ncbi:MAG: 30S ribosomal protein S8, partial [Candidatus Pacebacteria bacterium]|jgi:small subunit ribosomal protein S8|nr:30S ribosomal protein S8 [Candidatus Paceibacterota bacterium]
MDKIGDFLIALKNGGVARREAVAMPYSSIKHAIARVLESKGYISKYEKKSRGKGDVIEVTLRYVDGTCRIRDVKRVSKPSRRMYLGVRDVKPVKHGHGLLVLSTPKGLLAGEDALKERVGGEVLFEIW